MPCLYKLHDMCRHTPPLPPAPSLAKFLPSDSHITSTTVTFQRLSDTQPNPREQLFFPRARCNYWVVRIARQSKRCNDTIMYLIRSFILGCASKQLPEDRQFPLFIRH